MRSKTGRLGGRIRVLGLALWLAVGPALGGPLPLHCQIVPAADARHRLEIWGRELAGAKGRIAAHAARRVAWVADRQGVVLEALFLVTVQEAAPARFAERPPRPKWVRCTGSETGPWR